MEQLDLKGLEPELVAWLPRTEAECVRRLRKARWPGPENFRCRVCNSNAGYPVGGRPRVFVCKFCGRHTSVTAGTLMHRTRVDLTVWFLAAGLLARPGGCKSTELAPRAGVHTQTAWRILHRLRHAVGDQTRVLMRGQVRFGSGSCPLRQPRHTPRGEFRSVADEAGTVVDLPRWKNDIAVILDHAPHLPAYPYWGPRRPDHRSMTKSWLRWTHRWVSGRWLEHYLRAFTFSQNQGVVAGRLGFLVLALRAGPETFEALRPVFEREP